MTTAINTLSFDLAFSSQWWSFISSTRIFVSSFCGHSVGDPEFADKVAMATHELLENAVKYSVMSGEPVRCQVGIDEDHVWVRIQNEAAPEHIETLQRVFEEVATGHPLEVYIERMQRSLSTDKSELGLARIRYETDAAMELKVTDRHVAVCVSIPLPPREEETHG